MASIRNALNLAVKGQNARNKVSKKVVDSTTDVAKGAAHAGQDVAAAGVVSLGSATGSKAAIDLGNSMFAASPANPSMFYNVGNTAGNMAIGSIPYVGIPLIGNSTYQAARQEGATGWNAIGAAAKDMATAKGLGMLSGRAIREIPGYIDDASRLAMKTGLAMGEDKLGNTLQDRYIMASTH